MTINFLLKKDTKSSNFMVFILESARKFLILMYKDRELLADYLAQIWFYKGVF